MYWTVQKGGRSGHSRKGMEIFWDNSLSGRQAGISCGDFEIPLGWLVGGVVVWLSCLSFLYKGT